METPESFLLRYICILLPLSGPVQHSIRTSALRICLSKTWLSSDAVLILVHRSSFVILTASCQTHSGPGRLHIVRNTFVELSLGTVSLTISDIFYHADVHLSYPFGFVEIKYIISNILFVSKKQDNVFLCFKLRSCLIHLKKSMFISWFYATHL